MILKNDDGVSASSPEQAEQLTQAGYQKCYNPECNFHIAPEVQQQVLSQDSGYYTCANRSCKQSHDLMEDMPWHGAPEERMSAEFSPGGGTRIGLSLAEQAQIGEDVVEQLGSLPGYGSLTWWHPGGAIAKSPLDGATKDWGIEVKTIGYDAMHHRFIPGRMSEKEAKNRAAEEMGLRGILGVLVLLNYKTSTADIYVQEMPLEGWYNGAGRTLKGAASFRSMTGTHLLEKVPFKNPFLDPLNGMPHMAAPKEPDMPF